MCYISKYTFMFFTFIHTSIKKAIYHIITVYQRLRRCRDCSHYLPKFAGKTITDKSKLRTPKIKKEKSKIFFGIGKLISKANNLLLS